MLPVRGVPVANGSELKIIADLFNVQIAVDLAVSARCWKGRSGCLPAAGAAAKHPLQRDYIVRVDFFSG